MFAETAETENKQHHTAEVKQERKRIYKEIEDDQGANKRNLKNLLLITYFSIPFIGFTLRFSCMTVCCI